MHRQNNDFGKGGFLFEKEKDEITIRSNKMLMYEEDSSYKC